MISLMLPPTLVLLLFSTEIVATSPHNHSEKFIQRGIEALAARDASTTMTLLSRLDGDPAQTATGGYGAYGSLGTPTPSLGPTNITYEAASSENPCFEAGCVNIQPEVASSVISQLSSLMSDTTSLASTPSSSLKTSLTTSTSTRTAIYPNAAVATSIMSAGLTQPYMGLFNGEEQLQFVQEPVCWFANAARLYASSASVTLPDRRRQAPSTVSSVSTPGLQEWYFATELPQQLVSVYSVPDAPLQTTSTTCTGFDGNGVYTTSYVQVNTVATSTPASTGGSGRAIAFRPNVSGRVVMGMIASLAFVVGVFAVWL